MRKTVLIEKESENQISVRFVYNSEFVDRIKAVGGRNWRPEGKYWTVAEYRENNTAVI